MPGSGSFPHTTRCLQGQWTISQIYVYKMNFLVMYEDMINTVLDIEDKKLLCVYASS